ncbi:DUF4837 family protein [Fulvivirga sp. M361]|nr:DUF4837 family protein [Fulvivirga sp. M361]
MNYTSKRMMKTKILTILSLITILISVGCSENDGKRDKTFLPKATGRAGEMIVVMDSAQWAGELGEEIKQTFRAELEGLPRDERMFKINRVDPTKLNNLLKGVKNLLFVMTLDSRSGQSKVLKNYFTKSSLDRIKKDSSIYVHTKTDEFAKGQSIMYLFSSTEKALIQKIKGNKDVLQNYFNNAEKDRLTKGLFKAKESKGLRDMLRKEHECSMRVPFGYKLVVNEKGFIWFRQINDESDKNVFITYKDYISREDFQKGKLILWRDSVAGEQLFEDPDLTDSYIVTETSVPYIPVTTKETNFNGKYGVEMKGLWKTNNLSMGGPFLGFSVVDEALGRIYYIEGFVYSPGKNQREFMREMEVILSTFRIKEEFKS